MKTFDRIGPDTDMDQARADLAAEYQTRRAAEGEATTDGQAYQFAARRLSLTAFTAELGHVVTWDPPACLGSVETRWTCVNCGRAVLQRSVVDAPYGSALDERCPA